MSKSVVVLLANFALVALVVCVPFLWLFYTLRTPGGLNPSQYVTLLLIPALAGLFLNLPAVSIIATSGLLAMLVAWLADRWAPVGLTYARSITPTRLFRGERAILRLEVENQKLLPMSWISIADPVWIAVLQGSRRLDELLRFSEGIAPADGMEYALVTDGSIGPFGRLEREVEMVALRRGVYTLGPARVKTGDPFGIFHREQMIGKRQDVIVYPRIYEPEDIGLSLREVMGEVITRTALVDDPVLIAGSREYQPGDPLRRIHWKATARRAAMQVRVTEPSTTAQVMIVLNLNTFQHAWEGIGTERMEITISVAASLALWALGNGLAVGIHSNGIIGGTDADSEAPRIPASAHPQQGSILLEHLARLTFSGRFSPGFVLFDEVSRLRDATSIILVTSIVTAELISVLNSSRVSGRVSVVYCGRRAVPLVPGVSIHLAIPPPEIDYAIP